MTTKTKLIIAGVGATAIYFYMQQNKCKVTYLTKEGKKVCEIDLNEAGYYFYSKAPNGAGYYNVYTDFSDPFGTFSEDNIAKAVIDLLPDIVSINPNYTTAVNMLEILINDDATPIQIVS
jgi:hypothetical protein